MNTQLTNLFITDDSNRLIDSGHEDYLSKRSGYYLSLAESPIGKNFPAEANNGQNSFFINYLTNWKIENDVLQSFKRISPKNDTVLVGDTKNNAGEIDSLGLSITVFAREEKCWKKIVAPFSKVFDYPIRIMVEKFGINKYLSVFMLTSVVLGILADLVLRFVI
jgi:hypothetical protein